jgi:hypothetical protein
MNKTLFIGGTHGNEPIGVRALESLEKKRQDFDWIIGNPCAYKQNERYTEADLNRSAPGMFTGATYESRRAAEITSLAKQYDIVIDLHGTTKDCGIFTLITNPSAANLRLASMIDLDRIVIWPAITPDLKSPLSEFFPVGLEIECGLKDNSETQIELERVLTNLLENREVLARQDVRKVLNQKEIYEVCGELRGNPGVKLKEFQEVTIEGETFFSLLIGAYDDAYGVTCYKLKKRSVESLL